MAQRFARIAGAAAGVAGHYVTFVAALALILAWALTGPLFGFSNTWQLAVNTGTTVVTFLMVFLIQNTQGRDARAVHLKLDELIRALEGADDDLMRAEDETDAELAALKAMYRDLAAEHARLKTQVGAAAANGRRPGEAAAAPAAPPER